MLQGTSHVLTAGRSDDLSVVIDESAAQKGALHLPRKLLPLEWRISLFRFGLGSANHEAVVRIDETEALGRLPTQQLGHVVVGHAALAAFAHHTGEQIFGAAESRFGEPYVGRVGLGPFLLTRAAGMVADDPVDLAVKHRFP